MKLLVNTLLFTSTLLVSAYVFAQDTQGLIKTRVYANSALPINAVLILPINAPHVPSVIAPKQKNQFIGAYVLKPQERVHYITVRPPDKTEYDVDCGNVGRYPQRITVTVFQTGEESFKCKMVQS